MEILDKWVQVAPSTRVVGLRMGRQDCHFTFAEAFSPDRYTTKTAIADYWLLCQCYPFTDAQPVVYVLSDYPPDVADFLKGRSDILLERLHLYASEGSGGRLATEFPSNPLWDLANGLRYVQKRLDELILTAGGDHRQRGEEGEELAGRGAPYPASQPLPPGDRAGHEEPAGHTSQCRVQEGVLRETLFDHSRSSLTANARAARRRDIGGRFGVERRDLLNRKKKIKKCILHYVYATQSLALLSAARGQSSQPSIQIQPSAGDGVVLGGQGQA